MAEKLIIIKKKDVDFEFSKIKDIKKVDIFGDRIEIHIELKT